MEQSNLDLNFNYANSHKWHYNTEQWDKLLYNVDLKAKDLLSNRKLLTRLNKGTDVTPIMAALAYGICMDQKMRIENDCIRESVDADYRGIDSLIERDTKEVMALFFDDVQGLLAFSEQEKLFEYSLAIEEAASEDSNSMLFSGEDIAKAFEVKNSWEELQEKSESYLRSRLSQEFSTINGAVTTYHLIVNGPGKDKVSKALMNNSNASAWRIAKRLDEVLGMSKVNDKNLMSADHYLTDNKGFLSTLKSFFAKTDIYRYFNNCPIAETYKVVDDVLSKKYEGKKAGFSHGVMEFCDVCKAHADISVNLYLPSFINVISHSLDGPTIAQGNYRCGFKTSMQLGFLSKDAKEKGKARIEKSRGILGNPPKIVKE